MSLETGTLNQVKGAAIDDENTLRRCQLAKKLEEASDYDRACEALGELWQGVGGRPKLDGLNKTARAEALLRTGNISGWMGSASQIQGAQEQAKNLISESARLFESLNDWEKLAEAQIDLATCYLREGGLDEARVMLRGVLDRLENKRSDQRIRALINAAVVEKVSTRYRDALRLHIEAAPLVEASTNDAIKGRFHNEFATVLKNIGVTEHREDYIDRSLIEFAAAGFHFEQIGDTRIGGTVENNLGSLLLSISKIKEAHRHLNRARQMFVGLKDKVRIAKVDETRARAYMAEGRNAEAEKIARASVRALEVGGEQSNLAEALRTHATALSRIGRHQQAGVTFRRAVDVAEAAGHPESAGEATLSLIEELGEDLAREVIREAYVRAETLLARSQNRALLSRLGQCARRAFAVSQEPKEPDEESIPVDSFEGCSLDEEVLRYEANLIKQALEAANGSVTRAARLLKVTHQGLAFILQGRHKHLLSARTPVRKRRRSIIRAH